MPAGYSKRPLFAKLGMKVDDRWLLIGQPEDYPQLLGGDPQIVLAEEDLDGIHFFCNDLSFFQSEIPVLARKIRKNGMIWCSWYKKSAKLPTELSEDIIRSVVLPLGLVDVKVCAVDEKWSALKVVWRKELR